MLKNKHRKIFLICGLMLAFIIFFLPLIYTHYYHNITGTQRSINGKIDLSTNVLTDRKIYLDGIWEFYWEQLIISELKQDAKQDFMIDVPNEWSDYKINGKNLSAGGYGSYKLMLTGLTYNKLLTLYIPDYGGAYRVFIDGKLTAESGIVSNDINQIFTVPKANLYPVTLSDAKIHEVVIEVATTRFSGLYMTPILCDYKYIISEESNRNAFRFMMFGMAVFLFLCLIAIYVLQVRQKLNSLWMPIMILLILIRIMLTTEFYSFWQTNLFFNLSYEETNELMYLTTFVLKYMLIFLIQEQCGITFNKKEKIGFFLFYTALYVIYLLVPQNFYNRYLSIAIPMLTFTLDIYLFIKIYKWEDKLKKFGMAVFWGAFFVIVGLGIDSCYINGMIYINLSLNTLLFFMLFLLIMSCIYAMHVGDLYDDFTISSSRLEIAEKQITMQREHYDALSKQMNEIREIKHDINHFTGVMSQLAEEGNLDKLRMFLSEYCEKAKMGQLPVFCEHIIANSIIGYNYLRAEEYGIFFESRCNISVYFFMSDSDLCILLGNALENAVFACRQMDAKTTRFVSIESGYSKGQRLVKVTNSYNGQLEIIDGQYISSKKGNSHGLGLRNIEKVVETYGGFLKIEHTDKIFTLMMAIPENQTH